MNSNALALIPARGGSKGIPRKNVLPIAGKPLIAWSIEQALASSRIERVVVSTDDDEIADTALRFGAEVPFMRPPEFADDLSPDIDVFRHALAHLADHDAYEPEAVVHLRPTAPLRHVADIDAALDLLAADPSADAVRSVCVARQTPYKMWHLRADGTMSPVARVDGMTDCQSQPRQLLPTVYAQNGYVDVVRRRAIIEKGSMWGERVLAFVVDVALLDLDYPEDIEPMEQALLALQAGHDIPRQPAGRHSV